MSDFDLLSTSQAASNKTIGSIAESCGEQVEATGPKVFNLMTACDDGYAKFLYPQLASLEQVYTKSDMYIVFYLLYNRISHETLTKLMEYCTGLEHIDLRPILVSDKDSEELKQLTVHSTATDIEIYASDIDAEKRRYPYEVFFPLICHNYLPMDVDRVLYCHSADIIFLKDVKEFYLSDFHDKTLTVEMSNRRSIKATVDGVPVLYEKNDRAEFVRKYKTQTAYFNSGTFMINVARLRSQNIPISDYLHLVDEIISWSPDNDTGVYYDGDQAFFSIAFLGDVNSYHSLDVSAKFNYREYNYTPFVILFRHRLGQGDVTDPKVIHFDDRFKPWILDEDFFDSGIPTNITEDAFLRNEHGFRAIVFKKYYKLYWEFMKLTPIYDETLAQARILSSWTKKTYLVALHWSVDLQRKLDASQKRSRDLELQVKSLENQIYKAQVQELEAQVKSLENKDKTQIEEIDARVKSLEVKTRSIDVQAKSLSNLKTQVQALERSTLRGYLRRTRRFLVRVIKRLLRRSNT